MEKPVTRSIKVGVYSSSSSSLTINSSTSSCFLGTITEGLWFGNNSGSSSTVRIELLALNTFSFEDRMFSSWEASFTSSGLLIIALNKDEAFGISEITLDFSKLSKSLKTSLGSASTETATLTSSSSGSCCRETTVALSIIFSTSEATLPFRAENFSKLVSITSFGAEGAITSSVKLSSTYRGAGLDGVGAVLLTAFFSSMPVATT